MKKETLPQIFKRSLTKDAMDMIFITPEQMLNFTSQAIQEFKASTSSPEKQMMSVKNSFGIKVQSVVLPNKHQLFALKSEEQVLDWLQNKIHSIHSANYKERLKYDIKQKVKLKYQKQ